VPNIAVRPHTEVAELIGDDHLERVRLRDARTGAETEESADAMFVFIGAVPSTGIVDGLVETEAGFVVTGQDLIHEGRRPKVWQPARDPFLLETSVPGIFAAGDARHDVIRRVASAVGEGAVAVSLVHKYLQTV